MEEKNMNNSNLVELVKQLRVETGFGMMDCKSALVNCDWDLKKAKKWLENKGKARALQMFQTKDNMQNAFCKYESFILVITPEGEPTRIDMKTDLGFRELAELSDKELIDRYDYVVEKYGGEDIGYEMTNLAWEIANRFRAIVKQNKIPIEERTRGFFERG